MLKLKAKYAPMMIQSNIVNVTISPCSHKVRPSELPPISTGGLVRAAKFNRRRQSINTLYGRPSLAAPSSVSQESGTTVPPQGFTSRYVKPQPQPPPLPAPPAS